MAVGCVRRSLLLDQEMRHVGLRSLDYERQSLATAQTDLTRQREWRLVEEKTQQLKVTDAACAVCHATLKPTPIPLNEPVA